MGTFFGTDGIRGVANGELTPELAFRLGRAHGCFIMESYPRPQIIIGKDTRLSGDMLEAAYCAGACSIGADILKVGVLPTPAVAYLTRKLNAHSGVMISASHNPIEDNGIKLFSSEGCKLPDGEEEKIEELLMAEEDSLPRPTGSEIGRIREISDAADLYTAYIKERVGAPLSGLRVALDCAYGAAYSAGPRIFRELGADVIALHDEPDGSRINVQCGSTNTALLKSIVMREKLDMGLAFDGDADRCLAVDEKGNRIDGDQIMTVIAQYLNKRGELASAMLVATVMSNLGLEKAMKEMGVTLVRTKVGDRYVLEEMKKRGACLGGEQSGHIIMLAHNSTGDGVATAVLLAGIVRESGRTIGELTGQMKHMPQLLVNVRARNKEGLDQNGEVSDAIREMEELLKDRGRLLVRPSGTEPLIRVMAEGPDEKELQEVVGRLAKVIEEKLG